MCSCNACTAPACALRAAPCRQVLHRADSWVVPNVLALGRPFDCAPAGGVQSFSPAAMELWRSRGTAQSSQPRFLGVLSEMPGINGPLRASMGANPRIGPRSGVAWCFQRAASSGRGCACAAGWLPRPDGAQGGVPICRCGHCSSHEPSVQRTAAGGRAGWEAQAPTSQLAAAPILRSRP